MAISSKTGFILFCLLVCSSDLVEAGRHGFGSGVKFATEKEAKSFTRIKRVKRGWWGGAEEAKEMAGEMQEDSREVAYMNQELKCRRLCWKDWSVWSACGPCSTGVRKRSRQQAKPQDCQTFPCPGPAEETQVCYIRCGAGGEPQHDKCSCRTGWTGTCCEKRVECPRPANPANGYIEGNPSVKTVYDDIIVYRCDTGYGRIGPEQRRCQADGKWTGKETKCDRVVCPAVPSPPNGELLNVRADGVYYAGMTIHYKCKSGYELHGVVSRSCEPDIGREGKWSAPEPLCKVKTCGDPGIPSNGKRTGIIFTHDQIVKFECNRGYQLIGTKERECVEEGNTVKWTGSQPVCKQILCAVPSRPRYGDMIGSGSGVDTNIDYVCRRGYELIGNHRITCQQNGSWSGKAPKCQAIGCGDPGKPGNGTRHDHGFTLGKAVNFSCYEGFILDGARDTHCLSSKKWSNSVPRCVACPLGYYSRKDIGVCERCPVYSHTATAASYSRTHCVCDHGYAGPPGGPCIAVQCPVLKSIPNGKPVNCSRGLGDTCLYECKDGYVIQKGSSVRSCTYQSTWDGTEPSCVACPKNTYKASPGSCLPCPKNAYTSGPGKMREACKCQTGYKGPDGGPCTDVNECATKDGLGPCEQKCSNYVGGFNCECVIPGHKLQDDGRLCYAAKSCTNLTSEDAPEHGGILCHYYKRNNAQHCTIKCNPGYELPERTNAFETCGPTTGFIWSFRTLDKNKLLTPCIEEFFPGFRFESNSAYFVRACDKLNNLEQHEVKREFANLLTDHGVCIKNKRQVCNFRDIAIICGKTRKKRDTETMELEEVDIKFNVTGLNDEKRTLDCDKICPKLRIPARYCAKYCLKVYKRYLKAAVLYARVQLQQVFTTERNNMTFRAAAREFKPQNKSVTVKQVEADCDIGLQSVKGMCVPCLPGQFYSLQTKNCTNCPRGEYQTEPLTTSCKPCPTGETTTENGATSCTACPDGMFGVKCSKKCNCVHGTCDKVTGDCDCQDGWEGPNCDRDVDDCEDNSCFKHVKCNDTPAPGRGFSCGLCPNGLQGDGIICRPEKR